MGRRLWALLLVILLVGAVVVAANAATTSTTIEGGNALNAHCNGSALTVTKNGLDAFLDCAPTTQPPTTQPPGGPTVVGASSGIGPSGSGAVVVPKPTGTANGDVVIVGVNLTDDGFDIPAPAGWVVLDRTVMNTDPGSARLHTFAHTANNDGSNYSFATPGNSGPVIAGAESVRNAVLGVHDAGTDATGPALTTPTVTPQAGALVISVVAQDQSNTAQSYTPGSGWTERLDASEDGNQGTIEIETKVQASATGVSGAVTYTGNGAAARQAFTAIVALNPTSGTPTTTVPPVTTTTPPTTTAPPTTTQPPNTSGRLFTANSLWNTPLPAGATFHDKAALRSNFWYLNYESYGIPVFRASGSDPLVTVHVPATWGWPAGAIQVNAPAGLNPAAGSDANLALINGNTSYDFWIWRWNNTAHTDATVSAWAKTDIVTDDGWGNPSPWQAAGIRAAGSSTLGGLIIGHEATTGINHALAIAGPGGQFCAEAPGGYVAPAISGDSACEGPRLGIPPGVAMPGGLSVQGQNVWKALQKYGGWAVDTTGCCAAGTIYADPNSMPVSDVGPIRNDLTVINQYVRMVN